MTGGVQQFARVVATIPTLTPITTRCIPVDIDRCLTCTDEEWEALMRAKYPEYSGDFDDLTPMGAPVKEPTDA